MSEEVLKIEEEPVQQLQVVGLTPEQEKLLEQLQAIKGHTEKSKPRCPGCGSDLHKHCRQPAHHSGPVLNDHRS